MTVLVLQHSPIDAPAALSTMTQDLHVHRCDLDPHPPSIDGFEAVIALGGPQHVYTDEGFPSRKAEIRLLEAALAERLPILGVCLGSQLLAMASGGSVVPAPKAEVGWHPVLLGPNAVGDALFLDAPETFTPWHWHGDIIKLPETMPVLASSAATEIQAFKPADNAWGILFHFEVEPAGVEQFVEALPKEMRASYTHEVVSNAVTDMYPTALGFVMNFSTVVSTATSTR